MTDAREKIAEVFKSTLEFDGVVYNTDQTIDAILSALPSIVREDIERAYKSGFDDAACLTPHMPEVMMHKEERFQSYLKFMGMSE